MAATKFEIKKIDNTELYNLLLDGQLVLAEAPFTEVIDYIGKKEVEADA